MKIRPVHLAVAALTAVAAVTSAGTAQAGASLSAERSIGRYTAYQACQSAIWKWTADNAKHGDTVWSFRHHYRAKDVWRQGHAWHVQVGGKRGEKVTANNHVNYCVIGGTNARPKLIDYAFPR